MKKILFTLLIMISTVHLGVQAQVSITGVVNRYFKVTAFTPASGGTCSAPATLASVTIGTAYGAATPVNLVAGMEVLIIQMQAGTAGVMDRTTTSAAYGNVSNVGGAGNYEFATISTVVGSTVTFTKQLVNTYDPTGKVQLIPTWLGNAVNTNYTTTGIVTPLTYDETNGVGGVLVISTTGTITLNHHFNGDAMGFQGGDTIGDAYKATWPPNHIQYACCGTKVSGGGTNMETTNGGRYAFPLIMTQARDNTSSPCTNTALYIIKGCRKGKGIFGVFAGEELSKGKAANGGGGAHGYNSGGAGGGGYNGGGNGGYELAWACNDNGTGTQPAGLDHGGRGGLGMMGGTTALFMGGGGGAGHGDGNSQSVATATTGGFPAGTFRGPTSGGDGGAIVIVKANQLIASGAQTIRARGAAAGISNQDGAGGGGGGGTIILEVPAYSGSLTLDASGGDGGHVVNPNSSDCHGTGGGGGGGRVILSVGSAPAGVTINTNGGVAGRLLQFNCGSGSCSGGDEYVEAKTSQFCGANVFWGAGVGTSTTPTYTTPINTQTCGPLPVTLLNFQVELLEDHEAGIYWATASEYNTDHFIIERSTDGVNFSEIGKESAHTNSQQILYYAFTDKNLPIAQGFVYYRLKVVDLDLAYVYSSVGAVTLKGSVVALYPNPVKESNELTLTYYSYKENEQIKIEIIDNLGKHLMSQTVKLQKGNNEIKLSTKGIASGVYFIEINEPYGKTIQKIIVE